MCQLRDRKQDIPELISYLMVKKAKEMHLPFAPRPAAGAMENIMAHDWSGNIRELDNLVERSLITCNGQPFSFPELRSRSEAIIANSKNFETFPSLDKMIMAHIGKALEICNGKLSGENGAVRLLGIHSSTLRGKMRKFGIRYSN